MSFFNIDTVLASTLLVTTTLFGSKMSSSCELTLELLDVLCCSCELTRKSFSTCDVLPDRIFCSWSFIFDLHTKVKEDSWSHVDCNCVDSLLFTSSKHPFPVIVLL